MVPRDTYKTIPGARSFAEIPFDRWRELGADGLVAGSVERTGPGTFRVEVRLFDVRSRRSVMAKEYTGTTANPRLYAHTAADDIHLQQRALRGAARSKLTFASDRDGERVANAIAERDVKEIYISDYDGANQRRVTVTRKLNLIPAVVARRARDRLHVVPPRLPRHLHLAHLPGHAREPDRRPRPELAARVVARRIAPLLHVDARRELRALRDEPRRIEPGPADEPPGDRHVADLVAERHADRVHVGPLRVAADLHHRRRRPEPEQDHGGVVVRPADVVAGAVQRNRLRVEDRSGVRYQNLRSGHAGAPAADRRARAATRARRTRRTGGTWRSCRRGRARSRSS